MPQLDTSTWFITIMSMILTLFLIFQLKLSKHNFSNSPEPKTMPLSKTMIPWEKKWTKIYSPPSLPLR
uniref:ATP synthase complex subunit 8 n=1 Tax=Nasua nasua TaxID=9651 RepID=F4YQ66_NASNA|nr:ATP synthase F0 subunit 8 [Nasua nasua]ADG22798.1 ATP synthase F0 subunit 8 [Nasua nasua]